MKQILGFTGDFAFLSNFWPAVIEHDNKFFATSEHLFQSAKAVKPWDAERIRTAGTPGQAKRLARKVQIRADWEEIKVSVMIEAVRLKFQQNPQLAQQLIDTGDAELIEVNAWLDTFWGVCNGVGENWLGKILMQTREDLSKALTSTS